MSRALLVFAVVVGFCAVAAASPGVNPNVITSPFGSEAFTVSWLQSPAPAPNLAPIWSPIQSCGQVPAPTLLYADDPETWTTTAGQKSWTYTNPGQPTVTVNNLLLVDGDFSATTPGLIYFYFKNSLGITARLYVGGISEQAGATTFKFIAKETIGAVVAGAMETKNFLADYVPGTGYTNGSVNPGSTPTAVKTYTVTTGNIVQGEMYVTNLSGPAKFYVYADDCATACPGISNMNLPGDGHSRRGSFANAQYMLHHDFTPALETGSGGFSWYDVVGPSSCVSAIQGLDPFGFYTPRNSGDYGVPIVITGTPNGGGGGTEFSQFWFVTGSPAGEPIGTKDAFAMYVQGLNDPSTGVDVTGSWALVFPTSAPPTPSPQPTATALICCNQSGVIGLDHLATQRTITWIPSGGDTMPARFWYNVPALVQKAAPKKVR